MKKVYLLSILLFSLAISAKSQYTYKIKADSVLITNDSCTAELNLENSTKHIKGFLLNTGNGRTRFSRPEKLGDTAVVIGIDTIRFGSGVSFSALNGLSKIGNSIQLGGALTKSDTLSVMDSSLTFLFNNGSYKRIGTIGNYSGNIERYSSGRFQVFSEKSVRSNDYWNLSFSFDTVTKGYSMVAIEPTWGLKLDAGTYTSVTYNPRPAINFQGSNVRTRFGVSSSGGIYLTRFNLTEGEVYAFGVSPQGIVSLYSSPPLGNTTDSILVWNSTSKEIRKISQSSVGGGGGGGSSWLLAGNSGITNSDFLGTINNSSLRLRTNNVERMVVDSLGNVGIGVTNPVHKLVVNGNIKLQPNDWRVISERSSIALGEDVFGNYLFYGDTTSSPIYIGLGHQNKFHKFRFQTAGQTGDSSAMYNFTYNPSLGNAFQVYSFGDGNSKFMINAAGNVGILTNTPAYNLDINGTARVSTLPFIAQRDTVLTYNPSTKQIAATRIPVTNLMTGADIAGTTTAFATVTGLSFPVVANTTYRFRFFIVYTAAATTTGSKWSITGPSVAGGFLHYNSEYSLTATTKTFNQGLSAYDLPSGVANATSATTGSNIAVIEGVIRPTANGSVSARVASEVAGSAITAKTGMSYVQFEVLQ